MKASLYEAYGLGNSFATLEITKIYILVKRYTIQKFPRYGLFSAIWKYEEGIASNRLSEWGGESNYVHVQTARQAVKGLFLEAFDGSIFFFFVFYFIFKINNISFFITVGHIYLAMIAAKS